MAISLKHPNLASAKTEALEMNYTEEVEALNIKENDISEISEKETDTSEEKVLISKLETLTVEQLRLFAKENNIEIKSNMNKAEIINTIVNFKS